MRIGLVTQWYEPEPGAAAHPTAVARGLAGLGHDVRVLTSFPSYPTGSVHDGYRMRWRQHERRDGIDVLRIPDLPSHDDSALRRAGSLTSFAVTATAHVGWLRGADACLVYLSPATVGMAAMALRAAAGVPYVLYVQDLWPETVAASGFIGHGGVAQAAERVLHRYLGSLYAHAHGVAAISPGMAALLAQRGASRVRSIPNWIDEETFRPTPPGETDPALAPDRTWIMYAGGIGDVQGLETAVEALAVASRTRPRLGLALVGAGVAVDRLRDLAARLGVADRVAFLGPRPMDRMPALMAQSAAQLVILKDLPLFSTTIPSKVQSSLACGRVVVCAVAGDAGRLVEEAGGIGVPPEDVPALAEALVRVADMGAPERDRRGAAGRRYYETHLSADVGSSELAGMLQAAAATRRRGRRP